MLSAIWSRTLEICTVGSFALGLLFVQNREAKFAFGGAITASLVLVLLYEIRKTKDDQSHTQHTARLMQELRERDSHIKTQIESIACLEDPELARIYREDEEERLRLERESITNIMRSNQTQRDALDDVAKSFTDSIQESN